MAAEPSAALAVYSPLSFLRSRAEQLAAHEAERRQSVIADPAVTRHGDGAGCWVRTLSWDTSYFGFPVMRVEHAVTTPDAEGRERLARALREAAAHAATTGDRWYLAAEVPAADPITVQAYGHAGFRVAETRVTYFLDDVAGFEWPERFDVRTATADDIDDLRRTAEETPNPFDRYHADPFFSRTEADRYLGEYAAASVRGLADFVLVPHDPDAPAGAFFTATVSRPPRCPLGLDHECGLDFATGRVVLVAVGVQRRHWHLRLLVEATRRFRDEGVDVAVMTTQVTNGAVIRNSERAGYRLGRTTHVFVASSLGGTLHG